MAPGRLTPSHKSPIKDATWLSKLFFIWLTPLLYKGWKRDLEFSDLYQTPESDQAEELGRILETCWTEEKKMKKNPKIVSALAKVFWKDYAISGSIIFLREVPLRIVQALLVGALVRALKQGDRNNEANTNCILLGGGIIVVTLLGSVTAHLGYFIADRSGMRARVGCSSLIYGKMLRLGQTSLSLGHVVNLMSNDLSRLDIGASFLQYVWIAPIQLGVMCYVLWGYLGWTCLVGMVFLTMLIPVQLLFKKLFAKLRRNVTVCTDKKSRLLSEVISGLKVIKMYTWENAFTKRVEEARKDEMTYIKKTTYLLSVNQCFFAISAKFVIFLTLVAFILVGNELTADAAFVTLILYTVVNVSITNYFPTGLNNLAEISVAMKRLQDFLVMEELPPKKGDLNVGQNVHVHLDGAGGSWTTVKGKVGGEKDSYEFCLANISCRIGNGEFLGILGPVGCGKSSLLQLILGELSDIKGGVHVGGRVAYASQQAWIFGGTLRDNILLGREYKEARYQETIRVCALEKDISILPEGDLSSVGETGFSLSGGQKARVGLARAIYSDADIYILDDPFSAVDASVGRQIYENCIMGFLSNKSRILITHQTSFVKGASQILLLDGGRVQFAGNYDQLLTSGLEFVHPAIQEKVESEDQLENEEVSQAPVKNLEEISPKNVTNSPLKLDKPSQKDEPTPQKPARKRISMSLYWKYFRFGGSVCALISLLGMFILVQVLFTACDYFPKYLTQVAESKVKNSTEMRDTIWIYAALIGIIFGAVFARMFAFSLACLRSSNNLHKVVFNRVVRTGIQFIEETSMGQILNRFTKDFGILDQLLPTVLFQGVDIFFKLVGALGIICVMNVTLIAPSALLLVCFYLVRKFYLLPALSVKRFEASARSEVLSHVSSTVNGLVTIRAMKAEPQFRQDFHSRLDSHSAAWFIYIAASKWLAYLLDTISLLYIAFVTFYFILFEQDGLSAGLSISLAINLTVALQFGIRQSVEADNSMVSFERVLEYTRLKEEAPLTSNQAAELKSSGWPKNGKISFQNVSLSYPGQSGEVCALNNINFEVQSGEKIGIVGRTGAGKSSVISTLFRLIEPTSKSVISIDGVNILSIGLHELRSVIGVIPQDPVLFRGTLRQNLNPDGINDHHFDDSAIWRAVKEAQLDDVAKSGGGLDLEISENGSNLSIGQKQLICLARVLLRQNKIIVMDEATANIDNGTDSIIQATLREKFAESTLLIVAHRLHTVLSCDRIMMMDRGEIVEFDTPSTLLGNPASILSQMAGSTREKLLGQLVENSNLR